MAIGTRIGPDGRPIDEGFFGLGNALASLPGTPVLPGGGAPPDLTGTPPSTAPPGYGAGYTEPDDPYRINEGPGFPSRGSGTPGMPGDAFQNYTPPGPGSLGYGGTGWGTGPSPAPAPGGPPQPGASPIQTNPGLPPPPSTAGTGGFFGGANPFQTGVTGSMNNQTVPFNSNQYVTPEAAQRLGSLLGANVVSQNTQGMASPGSGAPSAPLLGLDFGGRGDVQDAAMGATQLARGDRPEDVAARYQAGRTTKAWAGDNPVPQLAEAWDAPYWNRSTPVSTNTPNAEQAGFFGQGGGSPDQQQAFFTWLRGQVGQG